MKRIRSVKRAVEVLDFLSQADRPAGLSEISRALGTDKATVYRILLTLEDLQLVTKRDQRYWLGLKVFQLGSAYLRQLDIRGEAHHHMERLRALTHETVSLCISVDDYRTYVEVLESPHEVRSSLETGKPAPLHCGATGKAILAYMPSAKIEEVIENTGLPRLTPNTIVDPQELKIELQKIRAQGFAISFEERMPGGNGIAAPILDREGNVIADIGITGPCTRFGEEEMMCCVVPLKQACLELSLARGYEPDKDEADSL